MRRLLKSGEGRHVGKVEHILGVFHVSRSPFLPVLRAGRIDIVRDAVGVPPHTCGRFLQWRHERGPVEGWQAAGHRRGPI